MNIPQDDNTTQGSRREHSTSRQISPIYKVLPRLESVTKTGTNTYIARCPAHGDNSPSLSLKEADDGRLLIYCFAQCSAADVIGAIGLTLADLFPAGGREHYPRLSRFQRRVPPLDALAAIGHEALFVETVANDLARGETLTDPTRARLHQAADRIATARGLYE